MRARARVQVCRHSGMHMHAHMCVCARGHVTHLNFEKQSRRQQTMILTQDDFFTAKKWRKSENGSHKSLSQLEVLTHSLLAGADTQLSCRC